MLSSVNYIMLFKYAIKQNLREFDISKNELLFRMILYIPRQNFSSLIEVIKTHFSAYICM